VHDFLLERGLRDRSEVALVMPLPAPVPPSPDASAVLLQAFAERDIAWHPSKLVRSLDPEKHVAVFADGDSLPYDLFLGVPKHQVPEVVKASGMCVDGWIPVNPHTLETSYPGVYAVGDVTSVGTPKAGVFAEGQAAVVANEIIASVRGTDGVGTYSGRGVCYIEFGHDRVGIVDVTFVPGQAPFGHIIGPSGDLVRHKADFGTSRVQRWFDRSWAS
jgi:sulfide:quinone oxidoreductase